MTDDQGVLHHPDLIEDASAFKINFLPSIPGGRVVSRQGIEFEGILYSDAQLNHHVNPSKKIDVKYDPTSMRYIWASPTGDIFLKIPWRDIFRPDISYDEWKYARSQCGPIKNSQDIDRRFACIVKGRAIVEEGLDKTRAARKRFEHAATARSNAPHTKIETFDPASNSYIDGTSKRKPRLLDIED
jgi:putative transposase